MDLPAPTLADVLAARRTIAPYLRPTLLARYPGLDEIVGAEIWVKHENHHAVGAFKVRGGVNLVARLPEAERRRGVMAASTGNHGQSVAFAAQRFGVDATIFVPEGANPAKVASMRGLGATVVAHGRDFDEAREECARVAAARGARYVHSGDEPDLIAGVGTATLEVFEDLADPDVIVVPVGGGSGAAAAGLVAAALNRGTRVIGVQSSAAPAAYRSWKERRPVEDAMNTVAEGLATRVPFALPQQIMREHLGDFWLVSDRDILDAQVAMIEHTRNLVEAAGAAPLAGALAHRTDMAGARVVLMVTGGNVTMPQLRSLLQH